MFVFKNLIILCFLLPFSVLLAQNPYSYQGKVQNKEGEFLAFVAILPNDDVTKAVLSDIEGRFFIASKTPILSLTFRLIGSQTLRLDADFLKKHKSNTPLSITLKNADNLISEVTIAAGENPADALIRRVVAHKDRNNPEKLATFQCKTYNKVAIESMPNDSLFQRFVAKRDSSRKVVKNAKKNFKEDTAQRKEHQIFLMETVTERRFRYPNDNFERVLLNRVSGFQNTGIVAFANMVQPFSFYNDFLTILDKNYVNPISIGSPSLYFFNIEDTLYQGVDTVFLISFHPRKGKVFEGLTGVLHINSREWAVQNVRAKPTNPGQMTIKIEQQYRFDTLAAQWFPDQLNFELDFPKYPVPWMGMKIVGHSYISDVSINPPLKQKDFNLETPIIIEDNAYSQHDSAWLPYRVIAPLSIRDQRTYVWMDSISKKKHFNTWAKAMTVMASGKLPIKNSGISLDITRVFQTNNYENTRWGLGLTNARVGEFKRLKFWESSAYVGYGLADSAWKYGGSLVFRLAQSTQTSLKLSYMHDIREPGSLPELDPTGFVSRSFYANRFDSNDELSLSLNSRVGKRFLVKWTAQKQFLQPNYAYRFEKNKGDIQSNFNFTEFTGYLKYTFDEPQTAFFGEPMNERNRVPVVEVAYTHGFDKILRGVYSYDKWVFAVHQSTMIRRIGRLVWRVEGGLVKGNVPFAKLFTLNQNGGGGLLLFYVPNTFQTFNDTVPRLTDKFLNLYFAQSFGNILYRTKWSSPELSVAQNIAFGQLARPEAHQGIPFYAPSKPFMETGLILNNLLKVNYVNAMNVGLGAAVFHHWGTGITSWQSLNPRISMSFSL